MNMEIDFASTQIAMERHVLIKRLKEYGVGRRTLNDVLFKDDVLPRLGVRDLDDEDLCHEIIKSTCSIPGCQFTTESLLEFENHYNTSHRYTCCQCKKVLPSPHLLDLHIQEQHDSFFAVLAAKKASYCCYIEECREKFKNAEERLDHCVKAHKMPKDYRFDQRPKDKKTKNKSKIPNPENSMEVDNVVKQKQFFFTNRKTKAFPKYTGKKFTPETTDKENNTTDVNMDEVVKELKDSLPTE